MSTGWRNTWRLLLVATPAFFVLSLVLVTGAPAGSGRWWLLAAVAALSMAIAYALRGAPGRWTRTLVNLVEALREGDYSVRAWASRYDPEYAALVDGFNRLAVHLRDEHRGLHETLQLLSKTLSTLDGAVFAFEGDARLRMVNPAGERLLDQRAADIVGQSAAQLGLESMFALPSGSIHTHVFPGQSGRWQVSQASLRSRSQNGRLLILQPMERALRQEEAQAFRRLLRVLSHEINNSMAPITSMADTLQRLMPAEGEMLDVERRGDLLHGLGVIEQRSDALQRFLGGYAQLARLPPPQLSQINAGQLFERVRHLLDNERIQLQGEPGCYVRADAGQLEQVLINLLRNALEADPCNGPVVLHWQRENAQLRIEVLDAGPGLPQSDNLFVPFFTTKPNGSGIGLVLSRQIIEAQGGSLGLQPRKDGKGTAAVVRLPISDGSGAL